METMAFVTVSYRGGRRFRGGRGDSSICVYKRKNRRASQALFFLNGLCQAKVVDGIHGNNGICHRVILGGRRFRPRLAAAVEEV